MGNAKTTCRTRDTNEIAEGGCHRILDPTLGSGFFLIEAVRSANGRQVEFAKRDMGAKARERRDGQEIQRCQ